jgi:hypothetical protein
MTEAILKLALTSDGGKYDPGTITGVVPPNRKLGPLTMAGFYCFKITTNKYSFDQLKAMIKKKVISLSELMPLAQEQTLREQKANAIAVKTNYAKNFPVATANGVTIIIKVHELIHKPDLNVSIDFDKLTLKDIDPKYNPPEDKLVREYSERDLENLTNGR